VRRLAPIIGGRQPRVDPDTSEEAWGHTAPGLTRDLRERLASYVRFAVFPPVVATRVSWQQMQKQQKKRGFGDAAIERGWMRGTPCRKEATRVVGAARTLRYVPPYRARDLFAEAGGGTGVSNAQKKRAIGHIGPRRGCSSLVMEDRGDLRPQQGTLGGRPWRLRGPPRQRARREFVYGRRGPRQPRPRWPTSAGPVTAGRGGTPSPAVLGRRPPRALGTPDVTPSPAAGGGRPLCRPGPTFLVGDGRTGDRCVIFPTGARRRSARPTGPRDPNERERGSSPRTVGTRGVRVPRTCIRWGPKMGGGGTRPIRPREWCFAANQIFHERKPMRVPAGETRRVFKARFRPGCSPVTHERHH